MAANKTYLLEGAATILKAYLKVRPDLKSMESIPGFSRLGASMGKQPVRQNLHRLQGQSRSNEARRAYCICLAHTGWDQGQQGMLPPNSSRALDAS